MQSIGWNKVYYVDTLSLVFLSINIKYKLFKRNNKIAKQVLAGSVNFMLLLLLYISIYREEKSKPPLNGIHYKFYIASEQTRLRY